MPSGRLLRLCLFLLLAACLSSVSPAVEAGERYCGNHVWEACEFCGQDCFWGSGQIYTDLTHDCIVNIVDFGIFAQPFIGGYWTASADFNDDGAVDLADFNAFGLSYFNDYVVEPCEPCAVPDSCMGIARVNFSTDPEEDLDRIDVAPFEEFDVFVTLEGCVGMTSADLCFYTSDNVEFEFLTPSIWGMLEHDGSPLHYEGALQAYVTDSEPAWIKIKDYVEHPNQGLQWAQLSPPRLMSFEAVAFGGINGDPPPDSLGNCHPQEPFCGDEVWDSDPCEFCGQDAFRATGWTEMNHDCWVDLLDFVLFGEIFMGSYDPSGDFDDNGTVDASDFITFSSSFQAHGPVSPCEACSVLADSCAGLIRVNFSESVVEDVDRIDIAPYQPVTAYVVVDGCENIAGIDLCVLVTPNISITNTAYPTSLVLEDGAYPLLPPMDVGPHNILEVTFYLTESTPGQIWVRGCGGHQLHWAQRDPLRRVGFRTIASAGVNTDALPDSLGCGFSGVRDWTAEELVAIEITCSPNPVGRSVSLVFRLEGSIEARVGIFDVAGRLVRDLYEGSVDGESRIRWDIRSDLGDEVPSGVYFVKFSSPAGAAKARMILLR